MESPAVHPYLPEDVLQQEIECHSGRVSAFRGDQCRGNADPTLFVATCQNLLRFVDDEDCGECGHGTNGRGVGAKMRGTGNRGQRLLRKHVGDALSWVQEGGRQNVEREADNS